MRPDLDGVAEMSITMNLVGNESCLIMPIPGFLC